MEEIVTFAWLPCTWVNEFGMLAEAFGGALNSHVCVEIGIPRGRYGGGVKITLHVWINVGLKLE